MRRRSGIDQRIAAAAAKPRGKGMRLGRVLPAGEGVVSGGRGAGWKAGMMREGGREAPEWRGSRLTEQHMRDHVVGGRAAPEWRGSRPYGLALGPAAPEARWRLHAELLHKGSPFASRRRRL